MMKKRLLALTLGLSALAACSTSATPAATDFPSTGTSSTRSTSPAADATQESRTAQPRVLVSHDDGLVVLDGTTLDPLAELSAESFVRLSPAGDGRHVMVSEESQFRLVDLGSWAEPHGDHAHHHVTSPRATQVSFASAHPGHVVDHEGQTALFSDGDGTIELFDNAALDRGKPTTTTIKLPAAHHGVAVPMADGVVVHTLGTEKSRNTIVVRGKDGKTLAQTHQCDGVHGEAMAANDVLVFGCTDGVVVLKGTTFTKVKAAVPYARTGNLAGSPTSAVVLGDYKTDKNAKLERPTTVNLINTATASSRLVDLGASYSFRSLARDGRGQAIVLTTDGKLTVIDPETAAITARIPVIKPWTEPEDWKQARPLVKVRGSRAYVTDPATQSLHVIDLKTSSVVASKKLGFVPNELEANRG